MAEIEELTVNKIHYLIVTPTQDEDRQPRFWADLQLKYMRKGVYMMMISTIGYLNIWIDADTLHDPFPNVRYDNSSKEYVDGLRRENEQNHSNR